MQKFQISDLDLQMLNTNKGLRYLLSPDILKINKSLTALNELEELRQLQIELIKMQNWVSSKEKRLCIIFEGRDVAGKGGAIRRFVEHLNPRVFRVVALPKPTKFERKQWYFQRYIQKLPNPGEIVFFDRSWYNRAVIEPVNKFCTQDEYHLFMEQVPEFEKMLNEDGIILIKLWFSISRKEQERRFKSIQNDPLKQWKYSVVDAKAQELFDEYSSYKFKMFEKTHTDTIPWVVVMANDKSMARLESIKYVLNKVPYIPDEEKNRLEFNPKIVALYKPGENLDTS